MARRYVRPRDHRPKPPENPVQHPPVIDPRHPANLRRRPRLDHRPLEIRQIETRHPSQQDLITNHAQWESCLWVCDLGQQERPSSVPISPATPAPQATCRFRKAGPRWSPSRAAYMGRPTPSSPGRSLSDQARSEVSRSATRPIISAVRLAANLARHRTVRYSPTPTSIDVLLGGHDCIAPIIVNAIEQRAASARNEPHLLQHQLSTVVVERRRSLLPRPRKSGCAGSGWAHSRFRPSAASVHTTPESK